MIMYGLASKAAMRAGVGNQSTHGASPILGCFRSEVYHEAHVMAYVITNQMAYLVLDRADE